MSPMRIYSDFSYDRAMPDLLNHERIIRADLNAPFNADLR
jgi:hypothetical protein